MTEYRDLPFAFDGIEAKADSDGEVHTFRSLAFTFDKVALVGDLVEPSAFKAPIAQPSRIRLLRAHDLGLPLGTWEEMRGTGGR